MGIPAQIERQAQEAEVLMRSMNAAPPEEGDTPTDQAETAQSAPATADTGEPQDTPPPQPQKKQRPREDDAAIWRQRYSSLQGMFNGQTQQLQQLQTRLAELEARQNKTEEAPQPATRRVTEKDVESFGQDLIDVIRRQSQDEIDATVGHYLREIDQLKQELTEARSQLGNVSQTQAQTAKERFFADLKRDVPNWEQLQQTEECQEWLGTEVPGTDFTWDDALKDAASKGSAKKASEIFRQFLQAYPALDQSRQTAARQRAASEVARQMTPARSNAAPAPAAPGQKRMYTSAEFEADTLKVIRLSKQGKFDEAGRIEAELNAAMAEGRVRPV